MYLASTLEFSSIKAMPPSIIYTVTWHTYRPILGMTGITIRTTKTTSEALARVLDNPAWA